MFGEPGGSGLDYRGVTRTVMRECARVTFDTNTYRPVVEPERFANHPDHAIFVGLNQAIRDGRIIPFIGEALFTIEAIRKVARAPYLARRRPGIKTVETTTTDETAHATISFGPDHAQHPGLSERETERLEAALQLGFRLLAQPRIGTPRPEPVRPDLHPDRFADDVDIAARQKKFVEVAQAIESRGVGFARAKVIGERARGRTSRHVTWFELLDNDRYFNDDERKMRAGLWKCVYGNCRN